MNYLEHALSPPLRILLQRRLSQSGTTEFVDLDFIGVGVIGLVIRNENAIFLLLSHSQSRIRRAGLAVRTDLQR